MIHEYIFEMLVELAELANRINDDDLSEKLIALAHEGREQQ